MCTNNTRERLTTAGFDAAGWAAIPAQQQALIEQLLLERVCAKRVREFDRADELHQRLRDECGVFVNDRERTYRLMSSSSKGGSGRSEAQGQRPYTRDPTDDSGVILAPADEAVLLERYVSPSLRAMLLLLLPPTADCQISPALSSLHCIST
eukprot:COSAG05_NODE_24_length_31553_cov_12.138647_5_plen_152_part_00